MLLTRKRHVPLSSSLSLSRRPCWYSTAIVFRAAGDRKSPSPFSMGYGSSLRTWPAWTERQDRETERRAALVRTRPSMEVVDESGGSSTRELLLYPSTSTWLPNLPFIPTQKRLPTQSRLYGRLIQITHPAVSNSWMRSSSFSCFLAWPSSCTAFWSPTFLSTPFWQGTLAINCTKSLSDATCTDSRAALGNSFSQLHYDHK